MPHARGGAGTGDRPEAACPRPRPESRVARRRRALEPVRKVLTRPQKGHEVINVQTVWMWTVEECRAVAFELVGDMHPRWEHLSAVGELAERLAERHPQVSMRVVQAAWLHDIGYASPIAHLGFHPVDGADYLVSRNAPEGVPELVAFHTGASFEAEERALIKELKAFTPPDDHELDLLTMCDLGVSPSGEHVLDVRRVEEILSRYDPEDPVFRAVTRSRASLLEASRAGKQRLGLPQDWPVVASQSVADP